MKLPGPHCMDTALIQAARSSPTRTVCCGGAGESKVEALCPISTSETLGKLGSEQAAGAASAAGCPPLSTLGRNHRVSSPVSTLQCQPRRKGKECLKHKLLRETASKQYQGIPWILWKPCCVLNARRLIPNSCVLPGFSKHVRHNVPTMCFLKLSENLKVSSPSDSPGPWKFS